MPGSAEPPGPPGGNERPFRPLRVDERAVRCVRSTFRFNQDTTACGCARYHAAVVRSGNCLRDTFLRDTDFSTGYPGRRARASLLPMSTAMTSAGVATTSSRRWARL